MVRIYLDQKDWVRLARGFAGKEQLDPGIFAVLRTAADSGAACFPLSSTHYMETAKRNDPVSRGDIASVMLRLARPVGRKRPYTIAGPFKVLQREIDIALERRFDLEPSFHYPVLGEGAGHAFGQQLVYRVPDSIEMPPAKKRRFESFASLLLESALLAGPRDTPYIKAEHAPLYEQYNSKFLSNERALVEKFAQYRADPAVKLGWLQACCILDILDEINAGLRRARLRFSELATSAKELTSFLCDLPSRHVDYELQRLRYQNPSLKRGPGDLNDLAALSVAVPYCDIVVTERLWVDLIRRASLDARYQTIVLGRLEELPRVLANQLAM